MQVQVAVSGQGAAVFMLCKRWRQAAGGGVHGPAGSGGGALLLLSCRSGRGSRRSRAG